MIKEEDLMINDLVYHKIGTLQRVVHITIEGFAKQEDDLNKYYDYKDTTFGHLLPIPLTSEILEKNGWRMTECEGEYTHDDVSMFLITEQNYVRCVIADYNKFGRFNAHGVSYAELCELHYVHELQHVLRLCDLNELADKFKVE